MSTTSNRFDLSAEAGSDDDQAAAGTSEMPGGAAPGDGRPTSAPGQIDEPRAAAALDRTEPAGRASVAQKVPTRWAWNVPLLLATLAVVGIGTPVLVGLYYWQSNRIGGQLIQLADRAAEEGNPQEELQWLRRYLALQPNDVDAQVRMALTFDEHVTKWTQLDQSRRHLARALAAVDGRNSAVETDLRERLIERLLQLGSGWLIEVERQIIKLNPAPEDPQALAHLSRSMVGQLDAQVPRPSVAEVPEREEHFWRWLAAQPVGDVLRLAVAANPDSVELADAFLGTAINKPELFTTETDGGQELRDEARNIIEKLSRRGDNGQAQWTVYYHASSNDLDVQTQPLAVAAAAALDRLQSHATSFEPVDEEQGGPQLRQPGKYQPLWDAQLVLAHAANLFSGQAFDAAKDYFQSLASLPKGMLPAVQSERSFLGLGQSYWQTGDSESARKAWNAGNLQLGGKNLVLLESLAASSIQLDLIEEARQDLGRFAEAIQAVSLRLAGEQRAMSQTYRSELQTRLNTATWRIDVFHAHLDLRQRDFVRAAQRLERSVASQLDIDKNMRVEASQLLASAYGEQGLWDLAGRVLDAAAVLAPSDRALKKQAAVAWNRASSATRAAEQWQRADDGSFESALAYAEAVAASISAKAPAQRDHKPLVAAVKTAQQRLDRFVSTGEKVPTDAWRLSVLRLSLPVERRGPPVFAGEVSSDSEPAGSAAADLQELVDLSLQYPQAAQLQAITALELQRSGDAAAAEEVLERLASLSGVDPVLAVEVQVRLAAEQGAVDEAVQLLRDTLDADTDHRLRMAKFAAAFLRSISRPADAVALLMKLDASEHDPQSLLQLGELLLAAQPSAVTDGKGKSEALPAGVDVTAELQKVENAIRKLEGDNGTHWRLLAAERLLLPGGEGVAQRRLQLTKAAVLQSEILSQRPRWSRALALGGRIAAEQGDARKAVDMLRRAIAEGDQEGSTVFVLVKQLNRLGEVAAAEQELGRLERWADSISEISTLAVGLALDQGKFDSALDRARSSVAARPNDPDALIVLAQAAAAAAKVDIEQAPTLIKEADQALQQALDLTKGRSLGVWGALIRLKLETGGRAAVREVLTAMEQSELAERERFFALANGYQLLQDWDHTRIWLDKARQANPASADVALAQATLAHATNDTEGMVDALQRAYQLAPQREDIRRRLALVLAANQFSEVPWQRIDELVGLDRQGASPTDQLYHALILIHRGDGSRVDQARELLAELMNSQDASTVSDAIRLLVVIERRRWDAAVAAGDEQETAAALSECRRLYDLLTQRSDASPADVYRHADLLWNAGLDAEVAPLAAKMDVVAPGSRAALELRLQLAKRTENDSQVPAIVEAWLKQPVSRASGSALTIAQAVLFKHGFEEQGVQLMANAYRADPSQLRNFVGTLGLSGDVARAVQVCLEHFRKDRSPEPVALLADLLVAKYTPEVIDDTVEQALTEATNDFGSNIQLLESVGTLRLAQHRYADAVSLYEKAERLNPASLVTLNNLAVALAEIPGRHADALVRIERAVELYGRDPELLDTLGMVQLSGNLLPAAEATLREAYVASKEPGHLFHLLLVLHAAERTDEVKKLWGQLDLTKLNTTVFSPREQAALQQLVKQFGAPDDTRS